MSRLPRVPDVVDLGAFAAATAVRPTGDGAFDASLPEGWDIFGNVDGGLLLALSARAGAEVAEQPHPVTVTCHYLSPGRAGEHTLRAEVLRSGRRFATSRSTLIDSGGRPIVTTLGTYGSLGPASGALHVDGSPPDLPPPGDCEHLLSRGDFPPPFMDHVEVRLHPEDMGFMRGRPTGTPLLRGWFRLLDDEPVDTFGLLLAVDSFPPTIFNASLPLGWSPTVELTAHVRARPAAGWLACEFRTRFVTGGFLEVDGEVWDATGSLVAQSRQLALVPRG
jgi:acyl-CoA thioesterase